MRVLSEYPSVWCELEHVDDDDVTTSIEVEVFYMLDQDIETRATFPVVVGTAVVLPGWGRVTCHIDPAYDDALHEAAEVDIAFQAFR